MMMIQKYKREKRVYFWCSEEKMMNYFHGFIIFLFEAFLPPKNAGMRRRERRRDLKIHYILRSFVVRYGQQQNHSLASRLLALNSPLTSVYSITLLHTLHYKRTFPTSTKEVQANVGTLLCFKLELLIRETKNLGDKRHTCVKGCCITMNRVSD